MMFGIGTPYHDVLLEHNLTFVAKSNEKIDIYGNVYFFGYTITKIRKKILVQGLKEEDVKFILDGNLDNILINKNAT